METETVKIAICDDDKDMQEILHRKIEGFCTDAEMTHNFVCCDSGEEVLRQEPAPDILFLDIHMPERNGMETARELYKRHSSTILIFVTALSEYVYDAFDVGAFHYLVKPFSDEKLREVLYRALQQHRDRQKTNHSPEGQVGEQETGRAQQPECILIKKGGVSMKIALDDIVYAEVFNRKVMLHTIQEDIEYYGKLTELSEMAGKNFYRTHRAYLVNLRYVERYTATTIWLERGTALISKKQFAGFVRQYMQYINRRRSG